MEAFVAEAEVPVRCLNFPYKKSFNRFYFVTFHNNPLIYLRNLPNNEIWKESASYPKCDKVEWQS